MIAKLRPGMTRAQVRFALGSPLIVDPFRTDRWDYVYMFQKQGKDMERRNITVIFDDDKLVRIEGDVTARQPAAKADIPPNNKPAANPTNLTTLVNWGHVEYCSGGKLRAHGTRRARSAIEVRRLASCRCPRAGGQCAVRKRCRGARRCGVRRRDKCGDQKKHRGVRCIDRFHAAGGYPHAPCCLSRPWRQNGDRHYGL